jgi:hypothetical protein
LKVYASFFLLPSSQHSEPSSVDNSCPHSADALLPVVESTPASQYMTGYIDTTFLAYVVTYAIICIKPLQERPKLAVSVDYWAMFLNQMQHLRLIQVSQFINRQSIQQISVSHQSAGGQISLKLESVTVYAMRGLLSIAVQLMTLMQSLRVIRK